MATCALIVAAPLDGAQWNVSVKPGDEPQGECICEVKAEYPFDRCFTRRGQHRPQNAVQLVEEEPMNDI